MTIAQFQKIFVISLPLRTDHRDAVSLAAALTGLQFEFVDGVTEVSQRALPPGGEQLGLNSGALGNWRAHMNVAQMVVKEGISSALVLEDDVDWDLRIKSQMQDFAKASRLLVQPLRGTADAYLDPTHPQPSADQQPSSFPVGEDDPTVEPTTSPYGDLDRWDLFWIGHCGSRFPDANNTNVPIGRAVVGNDVTVPEPQHIRMQFGDRQLVDQYPAHTRVVSRARSGTCTVGYGVSQNGARRLLYELGVHNLTSTTDLMLRTLCDGVDGRRLLTCLSVQPQLFQHHRAVGSKASYSDISEHEEEYNPQAFTRNVRWSTRLNFEKLINNETDYLDLYKDGEPALDFGFR
ncbi:hypothetical protein LTR36_007874 [Oleoguttula mirabilis]|uniref:Glycosyl transferase family 25 domain-containing protein n=1 Tax=Oleoguttula mirabilis TaxID=1507867 RepID=A0AAV9J8Z7_9PEZI|nr:hypothetical protein LTR36_007874 [Oleoguttula mirabilis]